MKSSFFNEENIPQKRRKFDFYNQSQSSSSILSAKSSSSTLADLPWQILSNIGSFLPVASFQNFKFTNTKISNSLSESAFYKKLYQQDVNNRIYHFKDEDDKIDDDQYG